MRLYNIIRRLKLFVPAMALAGLASCQDVELRHPGIATGEEVIFSVPVSIPKMTVQSRSDISDAQLTLVKTLWIGVFSATGNGEMTSFAGEGGADGQVKYPENGVKGWIKLSANSDLNSGYEQPKNVLIKALSGSSYIVAIANVDNLGVQMNDDGTMVSGTLKGLLSNVTTWNDFLKIGAPVPSTLESAYAPKEPLTMSGCYTPNLTVGTHTTPTPSEWQGNDYNFSTVNIADGITTNGAIHLRRLLSHIHFNITNNENKVKNVEVTGFRVVNAPRYSWAYEQNSNLADNHATKDNSSTYVESINYTGQYISSSTTGTATTSSFDFWLGESKHTGNITTVENPNEQQRKSEYNQREAKDVNGIYTALSNTWTSKQLATYVVISCNVTYNSTINVNDNGVSEGTTTPVYRTGFAEYTVHLGYIGNDANDFNSYRNCDYTYNITVNGLNDIVVEANDGVERNAAEGTVIDVETRSVQLDSHFHAFNIALTGEELNAKDNDGNSLFGFIMSTSQKDYQTENDIKYTFTDLDNPCNPNGRASVPEYLYNWIEIKEAPSQTQLASFIPAKGGEFAQENRVISFAQFTKEVQDGKRKFENNRTYYFTIFVNEYTYDLRYGEEGYDGNETKTPEARNWQTYINQAPRSFIIRVRRKLSEDGNSIYARSKYAIQQSSIQSYYDTQTAAEGTAVGIEHINETQGLNLFQYQDGTSAENGRYNIYSTLLKSLTTPTLWDTFVNMATPQKIPELSSGTNVTNQIGTHPIISQTNGYDLTNPSSTERGYTYLPATAPVSQAVFNGTSSTSITNSNSYTAINKSSYSPQGASTDINDYILALNACMNRNRDENGNGNIDLQELKWYVPASGKYLRAILGRGSLTDPIMPYDLVPELANNDNSYNTRYLMYSSDGKILWAMEGLALSGYTHGNGNPRINGMPWNVRCIRSLGIDLSRINTTGDPVRMAYRVDFSNRKIYMDEYDQQSIRTFKYTVSGNAPYGVNDGRMPINAVTSGDNKVYKVFEFAPSGSIVNVSWESEYNNGNPTDNGLYAILTSTRNPCTELDGDGWRLPNQKELAIMRNYDGTAENNAKIFPTNNNNQFSSGGTTADFALSCTYDYYYGVNASSGDPFTMTTNTSTDWWGNTTTTTSYTMKNKFMATRIDGGTRIPNDNSNSKNLYIRCVRDVDN